MRSTEEKILILQMENDKLKKENFYLKEFLKRIKLAILKQLKQ